MSDTLTTRQREILDVIVSHVHDRGYPPSVREIGEAVGFALPHHRQVSSRQPPRCRLPEA